MTPDWSALDRELAAWQENALALPLWWRDDDATAPSDALSRLSALSARLSLPVHLAVIPRGAGPELAAAVAADANLVPVVHGWAHENHTRDGGKKSEFGPERAVDYVLDDAEQGLSKLRGLFGSRLQAMFVPPWNRISPDVTPWLAGTGFSALSCFGPRPRRKAAPGLLQVNTHLDPVDWHGSRSLLPPDLLLRQLVRQLKDRREGRADNGEPYGLLTHHLVHDAPLWEFTEALLQRLLAGPATAWTYNERMA